MKGVRFTKAELSVIEDALKSLTHGYEMEIDGAPKHPIHSIRNKLRAAVEAPKGVDIRPMEAALVKAARGKVIELEGGHSVASNRATSMKVTQEQVEMVGAYMARQNWLTSPMTILDVLNKWFTWLPKARATEPPPTLEAGLGSSTADRPNKRVPSRVGKASSGFR